MENIYERCSESGKEETGTGLESNFTSVFQQLVEKTEERGTEGTTSWASVDSEGKALEHHEESSPQQSQSKSQTSSTIVERNLELHLSLEAQQRIQDILNEVRQLSEKEKLLLYLKLPTKTGAIAEESQPIPLSNTRQEQTQAFQWIRSNLEECESTYTLPKHEVYDDYRSYCESLGANRTLSAPDFGKIIKCVFPKVKARRLGTRGNSNGLRKKLCRESPALPNVNGSSGGEVNNNQVNDCNDLTEDQTLSAACNLVCEWANKLLGRVFTTLLDLARFLVGGSYVSTKSMAAFVVMSATESKVRKMSEKLQFRSSSSSTNSISPDSKSNSSDGKRSPISTPTSVSSDNLQIKPQLSVPSASSQPKSCYQANRTVSNGGSERPQSLPGLKVAIGNQDVFKPGNNLMSPPQCPPLKTLTKAVPPSLGSPRYSNAVAQARGNITPSNGFAQASDGTFPVAPQQQQQSFNSHTQISSPTHASKRQTHVQRTTTTLKRSDSCPYPSQSPRSNRPVVGSVTTASLSPRIQSDVIRNHSWQSPIGSLEPSPVGAEMHAMKKMMQDQLISPLHSTTHHDIMTTPENRQPLLQRCHSVPVPFSSPQAEVYSAPLSSQIGAQSVMSPMGANRGSPFAHLKEMRTKFLNNEMQSNARRNLTPSFFGSDGDLNLKKARTLPRTVENEAASIPDRKPQMAIIDESSLASVDSLIDSPFSLGGIDSAGGCNSVTDNGGSGLSDLDGLDDAVTMDLLRSLNSGNNIWANEWNNVAMQLMETS
eukprot:gene3622-14856_t